MRKIDRNMLDWMKGSNVLNLVVMDHHMEKDENDQDVYVCDSCGAKFSSSSDLADHMKTHEAETQEMMDATASEDYSPEETQAWEENPAQMATENYGDQQENSGEDFAEEIPNRADEMSVSEETVPVDNESVSNVVNTVAEEENPSSETYQSYQDLSPRDETILPINDYDSEYTVEEEKQEFPRKQPIGEGEGPKEENSKEEMKPVYPIRFSDGEKVFYNGAIYSVIMPPGALEEAEKTGLVDLAIYGEGGQIVDRTALADVLLTPQSAVDEVTWNEAWKAQTGIDKTPDAKTETEKEKEKTPILVYFGAFQGDNLISSTVSSSPFVVKWKVQNVYRTVLQCPDGSEREGNEGQTAQLMENDALNYSLLSYDDKDNSIGSWSITVGNISGKTEDVRAFAELSPDRTKVIYRVDNFDPNAGVRIVVKRNGYVVVNELITGPAGEVKF